jgi:predicted nucleic acid-binding protein
VNSQPIRYARLSDAQVHAKYHHVHIHHQEQTAASARSLSSATTGKCASAVMALIYGTEKSSTPERNLADVEGLAARLEVLKYDQEAAAHTGQLRAEWAGLDSRSAPMSK